MLWHHPFHGSFPEEVCNPTIGHPKHNGWQACTEREQPCAGMSAICHCQAAQPCKWQQVMVPSFSVPSKMFDLHFSNAFNKNPILQYLAGRFSLKPVGSNRIRPCGSFGLSMWGTWPVILKGIAQAMLLKLGHAWPNKVLQFSSRNQWDNVLLNAVNFLRHCRSDWGLAIEKLTVNISEESFERKAKGYNSIHIIYTNLSERPSAVFGSFFLQYWWLWLLRKLRWLGGWGGACMIGGQY